MEDPMKGNRTYVDIGSILDDVFEAAKDFGEKMKEFGANPEGCGPDPLGAWRRGGEAQGGASGGAWFETGGDENADYYPNFSYPPMNVFLTPERSIVFEFAVAGFEEKNISLSFQGDYMVFSARIELEPPQEGIRYFKRRLKLKDIEKAEILRARRQIRPGKGQGGVQERDTKSYRASQRSHRIQRRHQDRDHPRRRIKSLDSPRGD